MLNPILPSPGILFSLGWVIASCFSRSSFPYRAACASNSFLRMDLDLRFAPLTATPVFSPFLSNILKVCTHLTSFIHLATHYSSYLLSLAFAPAGFLRWLSKPLSMSSKLCDFFITFHNSFCSPVSTYINGFTLNIPLVLG